MTNRQVLENFLQGKYAESDNGNLKSYPATDSYPGQLINYWTVIAEKFGTTHIMLNIRGYSKTTTTIINKLREITKEEGFGVIEYEGKKRY